MYQNSPKPAGAKIINLYCLNKDYISRILIHRALDKLPFKSYGFKINIYSLLNHSSNISNSSSATENKNRLKPLHGHERNDIS